MRPGLVMVGLWIAFGASWIAAALWSEKTERRASFSAQLGYRIVSILGAALFFIPAHGYVGPLRLWSVTRGEAWLCVVLIAAGLAFSWWARVHLGTLWSGSIAKKPEHRVVDTGPYGIVRHPIYTGVLLAVYATGAAKGTILGIIGALLITIGLWMKARLEEDWLRGELGTGFYDAYRRKVPMLLPFGPRSA